MDGDPAAVPPPMNEHVAAYFPARQEMVIFGGNTAVPIMCAFPDWVYLDTTYIFYDYANPSGSWTLVDGPAPPPRGRAGGAASDDTLYIFGGRFRMTGRGGLYDVLSDFWAFDVNDRAWRELTPPSGPSPRFLTGLGYEEENERVWLFGGNESSNGANAFPLGDLWAYSVPDNEWTQITPATEGPEPRLWHSTFFDQQRGRFMVFGGGDNGSFLEGSYKNDLWAFDAATSSWELVHDGVEAAPPRRFWGHMVHDTLRDVYVLFAGHDETALGNLNDTWEFDPDTNVWTEIQRGDTFNAPQRAFCDFPADFANIDPTAPERRNAGSLVFSETCGHSIAFGGKTDCGAINDVWRYTGGEGWKVEFSSGVGEVCLRSGSEECTSICN